jgi:hypothetical protein
MRPIHSTGEEQSLVLFGLITPILASVLWIISYATILFNATQREENQPKIVLMASQVLCMWTVGWRLFPYWVNGVFQACLGRVEFTDLDPKPLIPMKWSIGEVWRNGAILLYLVVPLSILIIIGIVMAYLKKKESLDFWCYFLAVMAITVCGFIFSPNYLEWLAD